MSNVSAPTFVQANVSAADWALVQATIAELSEADLPSAISATWVLLSGGFVFMMSAGFAMLETGAVRAKNTSNILLKNFSVIALTTLIWYLFGFAFAFGEGNNGFVGTTYFLLRNVKNGDVATWDIWFFQLMFAIACITVVSGAMAERTTFWSFSIWAALSALWVYPLPAHWMWSPYGWAAAARVTIGKHPPFGSAGALDFAGSGVVHTVAGFSALSGVFFLGPRIARYDVTDKGKVLGIPAQSLPLESLGVLLLWIGWLMFNAGSTLGMGGSATDVASSAAINSMLAGSSSFVVSALLSFIIYRRVILVVCMNGCLASLAAITGPCAYVEPWAAIIIGILAAPICLFSQIIMNRIYLDDPVGAFPVHGGGGLLGLLASPLFATKKRIANVFHGGDESEVKAWGLFMGGGAETFALHLILMMLLPLWALLWTSVIFFVMKLFRILRVSEASERRGVDFDHGEVSWGEYAADTIHNPFQPPPILVTPASDGGFVAQHVKLMPLHPAEDDSSFAYRARSNLTDGAVTHSYPPRGGANGDGHRAPHDSEPDSITPSKVSSSSRSYSSDDRRSDGDSASVSGEDDDSSSTSRVRGSKKQHSGRHQAPIRRGSSSDAEF